MRDDIYKGKIERLWLPVTRRVVVEEMSVEGGHDSSLHPDTWRTIIATAKATIVLCFYDQEILICKVRSVAGWLE